MSVKTKANLKSQPKSSPQSPAAKMEDWLSEWDKVDWLSQHGELAVDVFQNDSDIIIKSAVAGVKPADLDVSISNDVLTIRGKRNCEEKVDRKDYLFQECYWGNFSRTVVLPVEVASDRVKATLKNGILTILIPKIPREKMVKIEEVEGF